MTPMPDLPTPFEITDGPVSMKINAGSRYTEMGVEVAVHSVATNISVEVDLDYDPDYTYAVLQSMPQIMNDQMENLQKGSSRWPPS